MKFSTICISSKKIYFLLITFQFVIAVEDDLHLEKAAEPDSFLDGIEHEDQLGKSPAEIHEQDEQDSHEPESHDRETYGAGKIEQEDPLIQSFEEWPHPDEIFTLPGLNYSINFRQYSGYLNASNEKFLHYWFVESQVSPQKDPLLLWLNGGPGCSSLDGLLTELGPFRIKGDGISLSENPYSWNKVANILFLETPAGVGYSYSSTGNYTTDDDTVCEDNYLALQHFFIKFPQYLTNDFYISGESYAGVFVPTLSKKFLNDSVKINFKGFAIGNGLLDRDKMLESLLFFYYFHGILGLQVWEDIIDQCCEGTVSFEKCNIFNRPWMPEACVEVVLKAFEYVHSLELNPYNIYAKCFHSSPLHSKYVFYKHYLERFFPKQFSIGKLINGSLSCIDSLNVEFYLNLETVREALHVPNSVHEWVVCHHILLHKTYTMRYHTVAPQVLEMLASGRVRGLIYNGDVDTACNFIGIDRFVEKLSLPIVKDYEPWHVGDQIAGFVKYYQNLTLLTVKGSGHMVPRDKPLESLQMITRFLDNVPQ